MIKCLHIDDLYCLQHYDEIFCENKETCRAIYARGKRDAVRHGHWTWYYTSEMLLNTGVKEYTPIFQCSCCGHRYESYRRYDAPEKEDADYPNYCEQCGAKMDEDATDINVGK